MLKESDDLDVLGVTFDSGLTFERRLRSVSRAASRGLGVMGESWRVFRDRLLIEGCFWGFVLPVLECCSAVLCSGADARLGLLDRVVVGARFLAGGVLNCDLSHRRSVAVLSVLCRIGCHPGRQLCGTLPVPCVPVRVARSALVAHRYTFAPPRCGTSRCRGTFVPLSVSLGSDLVDPVFGGVGLAGFRSRSNAFLLA